GPRPVGDQVPEMYAIDDIGLYDADGSFGDIDCVVNREIPEIGVEAVIPWRQNRGLRPPLAAVNEEVFGVEHIELVFGWKGVGKELVGPPRRAVLGAQEAVFTGGDRDDLLVFNLINDIDEKPRVPARREDLGLRPFFSISRDDVLAGQRRR